MASCIEWFAENQRMGMHFVFILKTQRQGGDGGLRSSPDLELVKQQQLMDNQPPPQQAVAVVMDNRGRSYFGNTNTLTSGGNYPGNWLMCPITFLLLSCIVPLWCVGGDGGYGEKEMMGVGIRRWYGEEMMGMGRRWYGEEMMVGDELLEINGNSTEGTGHADAITIINHGGDIVKLTVRRLPESLSGSTCNGTKILTQCSVAHTDLELVKQQQLVGDDLLEINGNSTEGMGHADAITIIKHGGDIVKLTVSRLPESLSGRRYYCHDNL
eukprot:Em0001g3239a